MRVFSVVATLPPPSSHRLHLAHLLRAAQPSPRHLCGQRHSHYACPSRAAAHLCHPCKSRKHYFLSPTRVRKPPRHLYHYHLCPSTLMTKALIGRYTIRCHCQCPVDLNVISSTCAPTCLCIDLFVFLQHGQERDKDR